MRSKELATFSAQQGLGKRQKYFITMKALPSFSLLGVSLSLSISLSLSLPPLVCLYTFCSSLFANSLSRVFTLRVCVRAWIFMARRCETTLDLKIGIMTVLSSRGQRNDVEKINEIDTEENVVFKISKLFSSIVPIDH